MVNRRDDGYEIDTSPARLDLGRVHDWLSDDSYWARGRSAETVATSVAWSLCFGVYAPDGEQVGIARVVTDRATFAWICDVYIARQARGLGLGTWLSEVMRDQILEFGIRRIVLATADAHDVYAKAGFAPLATPERWMEIDQRGSIEPPVRSHTNKESHR